MIPTPTINLNITITTPEAAIALIRSLALNMPAEGEPVLPTNPTPAPAAIPANGMPQGAQLPTGTPAPAPIHTPPVGQTAPALAQPPAAVVPTSTPAYTFDDLARAAGPLMDAGKTADLQALLKSFGVQALTQLPKEQYGAFATALRGLGARIQMAALPTIGAAGSSVPREHQHLCRGRSLGPRDRRAEAPQAFHSHGAARFQ